MILSLLQAEQGRLPQPGSAADADVLIRKAREVNAAAKVKADIVEDVLKLLAFGASGDLNPMAAMFGGIVGQEVVKAATGKFHPLFQWLYFDSVESLPPTEELTPQECAPQVCYHCHCCCHCPYPMSTQTDDACGVVRILVSRHVAVCRAHAMTLRLLYLGRVSRGASRM